MSYHSRRFFGNETVEEKTRKYTRPHPVVTSHLRRSLQPQVQTTSWTPIVNRGFVSTFPNPAYGSPIMSGSPLMSHSALTPLMGNLVTQMRSNSLPDINFQNNSPVQQRSHGKSPLPPPQSGRSRNNKRRIDNPFEHENNTGKKKKSAETTNNDLFEISTTPDHANLKKETLQHTQLTREILDYARQNSQSDDLLRKKLQLRSALLSVFRRKYPEASLHLVGSSCNGFAGKNSDADFCVMLTQHRSIDQKYEACSILSQLRSALRYLNPIKKIILIRAKVPILKFVDQISGVECDVNVNNAIGIRNTHLLRSYSKFDNRLVPLVLIIKHWAKKRNINDAACGTLSSYSLVLMVIHFLQCGCTPPVLISLQKEHPNHFNSEQNIDDLPMYEPAEFVSNRSRNTKDLGELLCGFFDYYAYKFKWDYHAASVRLGRVIPKSVNAEWKNKFICVEEPFDLTNTARAVYDYGNFTRIKEEFRKASQQMKKDPRMSSIVPF